jgi:biopolymer transport protein ExbD
MSRGSLKFLAALVSGVFAGCSDESTQAIAPSVNPDNIVITLDRKGNMYWNGKPVQNEEEVLAILAQRSAPKDSTSSNVITLEVLGDGSFVWNGERVPDAETLDQYWQMAAAQEPKPEVHVKAAPDATADAVQRALDLAEKNGAMNLGFAGNGSAR